MPASLLLTIGLTGGWWPRQLDPCTFRSNSQIRNAPLSRRLTRWRVLTNPGTILIVGFLRQTAFVLVFFYLFIVIVKAEITFRVPPALAEQQVFCLALHPNNLIEAI